MTDLTPEQRALEIVFNWARDSVGSAKDQNDRVVAAIVKFGNDRYEEGKLVESMKPTP